MGSTARTVVAIALGAGMLPAVAVHMIAMVIADRVAAVRGDAVVFQPFPSTIPSCLPSPSIGSTATTT